MKQLFTIHAGEFLVGEYLEKNFKNINIWLPSKDTGIDLLVTNKANKKPISLQVKFSRDFLPTHMPPHFRKPLRACGWWTLNRQKILKSPADFWVFVLIGFDLRSTDFIIIKPEQLLKRLSVIHGKSNKTIQSYLWVTENEKCWKARGLKRTDHYKISDGTFKDANRNFSNYLNNWTMTENFNHK